MTSDEGSMAASALPWASNSMYYTQTSHLYHQKNWDDQQRIPPNPTHGDIALEDPKKKNNLHD